MVKLKEIEKERTPDDRYERERQWFLDRQLPCTNWPDRQVMAYIERLEEALISCIGAWDHEGEPNAAGYENAVAHAKRVLPIAALQGKES